MFACALQRNRWSRVGRVWLLIGVLTSGCVANSPQGVLTTYSNALESNDLTSAYEQLSDRFKKHHDEAAFRARVERLKTHRDDGVRALREASEQAVFIDASIPLNEFDVIDLTLTGSGWRIDRGLFNFYGQRTPRETLRTFVKALERQRYVVLMRLIPAAYAQHMNEEMLAEELLARRGGHSARPTTPRGG